MELEKLEYLEFIQNLAIKETSIPSRTTSSIFTVNYEQNYYFIVVPSVLASDDVLSVIAL